MSQPESAARVLAVIPARGGSKGVPGKNLARVGGVPLVARAVRQCLAARLVTDVVVSTDDDTIASVAREAGAEVVRRPAEIAGDTASSEAAVLHALDSHEEHCGATMAAVLLVQCTSPFLTGEDIDGVTRAVLAEGADSALTVAPFHGFIWRDEADEAEAAAVAETPAAAKTPAVAEATAVAKAAATGAAAGTATGAAPTKVAPAVEATRPRGTASTMTSRTGPGVRTGRRICWRPVPRTPCARPGSGSTATASSAAPPRCVPTPPACWRSTSRTT